MLEIGLHGLAFALTVAVIAGLAKGGKRIGPGSALAAGIALGYAYKRAGDPWAVLSDKAAEITGRIGDEFGAVPAATALALAAFWWYKRPGPLGSTLTGLLLISAAEAANTQLIDKGVSIIGSLVDIVAG